MKNLFNITEYLLDIFFILSFFIKKIQFSNKNTSHNNVTTYILIGSILNAVSTVTLVLQGELVLNQVNLIEFFAFFLYLALYFYIKRFLLSFLLLLHLIMPLLLFVNNQISAPSIVSVILLLATLCFVFHLFIIFLKRELKIESYREIFKQDFQGDSQAKKKVTK